MGKPIPRLKGGDKAPRRSSSFTRSTPVPKAIPDHLHPTATGNRHERRKEAKEDKKPSVPRPSGGSYTVVELAEAERVSRAFIYKMWALGKGPRFYTQGNRRRISEEMREEWHRELEAVTNKVGA
jgi:hypothetical protein